MSVDPDRLLAVPRARRLLWHLAADLTPTGAAWFDLEATEGPVPVPDADLLPGLRALVRAADPVDLPRALAAAVDWARYWQPPTSLEHVLARPAVRAELAPLAALVAAHAPAWWSADLDRTAQQRVRWVDERIRPAEPSVGDALRAWRDETRDDELRTAELQRRDDRPWSSVWWSTPGATLPSTTRAADGLPAVHLALVEDAMGWEEADVTPVATRADARIAEVHDAADWAALVARYPLEVTHARRYDWLATTGRTGRWFLPDFVAVAADHDAVHVSVAGYLDATGWAVPVPGTDGATVLAGWSPDQTWWLTTTPEPTGPGVRWRRAIESERDSPWSWVRA